MPHVIVKLWPRLAEAITKDVTDILGCGNESVSVAMEEVGPQDWTEKAYKADIQDKQNKLYKEPGYTLKDL